MLWLQFKLWLIEKALRHHFGGHGEHFGHVVATATVPHRRARIATHALARFGIKRPAVEAYPERMLPWLHGMTNEGLLRMPLFFDGQPHACCCAFGRGGRQRYDIPAAVRVRDQRCDRARCARADDRHGVLVWTRPRMARMAGGNGLMKTREAIDISNVIDEIRTTDSVMLNILNERFGAQAVTLADALSQAQGLDEDTQAAIRRFLYPLNYKPARNVVYDMETDQLVAVLQKGLQAREMLTHARILRSQKIVRKDHFRFAP
jgi:hypothetical protein